MIYEDDEIKMNEYELKSKDVLEDRLESFFKKISVVSIIILIIIITILLVNNKEDDITPTIFSSLLLIVLFILATMFFSLFFYKYFYKNDLEFQLAQEILRNYKERVKKGEIRKTLDSQAEKTQEIKKMKEYVESIRKKHQ